MTTRLIALLALACATLTPPPAPAQDRSTLPIRIIASSSAGGLSDRFIRLIAAELTRRWSQPVEVENKPGEQFNVGAKACAEAAPDGTTFCVMPTAPHTSNQFLFKSLPYNPEKDFQPVTNLFYLIQMLVVSSQLNAKTVDDLVAASKARPGGLAYTAPEPSLALYMDSLKERGANWRRVPFRGGADVVKAILNGETPIALFGEGNVVAHIRSGAMTPLVMMNNIRSPNFPQVPTIEETGYKGPPSRSWDGLFAPAGTPRPLVDRMSQEIARIVGDAAFRERELTAKSLVPAVNTPDEFAAEIKRDRALAERVIRSAGLMPQ